ncbi:heterokaryon incompatibility protein-domain-containing protein [Chaetomidium leptoderma]|uniref:Heterokaryon incompatibility protein-domain-containing protein n=1 Tax=Chaetomidium leptoderma TaxID=669021 RepID=A0AAN6VTP3_9PEZI|nr:heterokaryon incompatibility protein-domain-containing protein [Chaetomidium leptoderma]
MALPYEYKALSHDDEIRLLHLKSGPDDGIHFTLHAIRLSDKPSYEAISYCWGDAADTREVRCEGKLLHITNSLYTALKRFRKNDAVRVLWADAVCINQTDIKEKSSQVQLMDRIYLQPTRVLVWLGEDMSGLEGLDECIRVGSGLLPPEHFEFDDIYPISRNIFREAWQLRHDGQPNFNDHDWRPMANLLCRPWFDRRWIIQEVALADDSVPRLAMCGDMEFSWNDLASVAYRLAAYGISQSLAGMSATNSCAPYMASFFTDGARPWKMLGALFMTYMLKKYRHEGPGGTLVDCVTATFIFKCSDPRDHLYSLLSVPYEDSSGLKADYALPIEEVCMNFAVATLVSGQNLKVLSLAPHTTLLPGGQQPSRLALPSWVPDLACQGLVDVLISYTIRPQLFHAGGEEKPNVRISPDRRLLHVRGRIVDKVARMAQCRLDLPVPTLEEVHPRTGFHSLFKKRFVNWVDECCDVAGVKYWSKNAEAASTGREEESEQDAESRRGFLETLICGMTGLRDPAPEELLAATRVYVDYHFDYFTEGFELPEEVRETILTYGSLVEQSLLGMAECRRFCRTEQGRLGQVRAEAREGDVFACIVGAEVPYLLRPSTEREGVYVLVGESFLLGVMQGEAMSDARYETIDITIE